MGRSEPRWSVVGRAHENVQIRCIRMNIHCKSTGPPHLMNSGEMLSGPAERLDFRVRTPVVKVTA